MNRYCQFQPYLEDVVRAKAKRKEEKRGETLPYRRMTSDKHTRPYTNPGLRAVTSEICLASARDEHGERALDSGFDGTASNPGVTCLFVRTCLRLLSCLLVIVAHVVGGVRSVLVAMEGGSTGRPFSACRDCLAAENDILSGGV